MPNSSSSNSRSSNSSPSTKACGRKTGVCAGAQPSWRSRTTSWPTRCGTRWRGSKPSSRNCRKAETMDVEALDIQLLGKEYRVSVKPEEREDLLQAVRYVDEKLADVAARTQSGGEKLAVMTALNIAHEFLQFQRVGGVDLQSSKRRIGL